MIECIIDCDPGIDDALALIFASKIKNLNIQAITTVFGNSSIENTSINALKILELINCKVPVAVGCGRPIIKDLRFSKYKDKSLSPHGSNGLADVRLPQPKLKFEKIHAIDLMNKTILENPKRVTLIFLGPLTNLALLILKNPRIIDSIKEVIIMGGAVNLMGNVTKYSEFNIWADAEAAKIAINNVANKIILVPLDVTTNIIFKNDEILDKKGEYYQFIYKIIKYYSNFHLKFRGFYGSTLHDPFAVGVALDRSFAQIESLPLEVEIENREKYGKININKAKNKIKTCIKVSKEKSDQFLEYFTEKILDK